MIEYYCLFDEYDSPFDALKEFRLSYVQLPDDSIYFWYRAARKLCLAGPRHKLP